MGLSFDPTYFIGSDLKLLHYRPGEMEVEWRFLHWLLWYYEMTNAFGYTHTNILTNVQGIWFIMKKVVKRSIFDEVAIKLANTGIKIAMVTYIDKKSSRNPRFTGAEPFEKYNMPSADGLSSGLLRWSQFYHS